MTKPILANNNALEMLDSGVWVSADESARSFINYTDGTSTENKVYAQVEAARDRSVFSDELDQAWEDWALEYHLGSKRANIYRGLNLQGVKTVLEVGCGCGAITRFLGEQGFRVDAIEGTLRRAEIARLRTSELNNVQIISSNYHALELVKDTYDLVVFTGVLEYSGAYAAKGVSPEQQLKKTLAQAQAALTEAGQILIAIENRTGFKYLAGASEDHLNVPNVGLLNYPEPRSGDITRGIRTWSKQQWRDILDELGFAAAEFCYPFPDYKVPDAILSDHFLDHALHPEQVLGNIRSRDYFANWLPKIPEALFWQIAGQTRSIDQYANSFLIVAANQVGRPQQLIDFDFVRFANVRRQLAYRMQVTKKQTKPFIQRLSLESQPPEVGGVVTQIKIENEPFVDGRVLEQVWQDALSVLPSFDELSAHLADYSQWLVALLKDDSQAIVDALPQNIIVDAQGQWHLIDQEWRAEELVSVELIAFRALFYFAHSARDVLADIELNASSDQSLVTIDLVKDFIRWGLEQMGLDFEPAEAQFLVFETAFQKQVSRPKFIAEPKSMLESALYQWHPLQQLGKQSQNVEVRAFWTQVDGVWHLDHSSASKVLFDQGYEVQIELPQMITTHRYLRIDPAAEVLHVFQGGLTFDYLNIMVENEQGVETSVYEIVSTASLFSRAKLKGIRPMGQHNMLLSSDDARIVLDLNDVEWGDNIASIKLKLKIDSPGDLDVASTRRIIREESLRSLYQLRARQNILDRQAQRIEDASQSLQAAEQAIKLKQQAMSAPVGRLDRMLGVIGLRRKRAD